MEKYFVLFKRQPGQTKDAFSVVDKNTLKNIDKKIIKAKRSIGNIEIPRKEDLKAWLLELGGTWYGD